MNIEIKRDVIFHWILQYFRGYFAYLNLYIFTTKFQVIPSSDARRRNYKQRSKTF